MVYIPTAASSENAFAMMGSMPGGGMMPAGGMPSGGMGGGPGGR
ncbi:hypothetical protein ACTQ3X_05925 [Lawsonibacter sp. LCP25S3_E7]